MFSAEKYMKVLLSQKVLLSKFKNFFGKLHKNQRLYVTSLAFLIVYFASSVFLEEKTAKGLYYIFIALWSIAIVYDFVCLYSKLHSNLLAKAIFLIAFSFCTNFDLAWSGQVVNQISGADPSKFPHTLVFVSILNIPAFLVFGIKIMAFLLPVVSIFIALFFIVLDEKTKEVVFLGFYQKDNMPFPRVTVTVQLLSLIAFCTLIYYQTANFDDDYNSAVGKKAQWFLYMFEMYSKSPCMVDKDSRISFLSDTTILVGKRGASGYSFEVKECKRATN
jgi:hypothetical protein